MAAEAGRERALRGVGRLRLAPAFSAHTAPPRGR